VPSSAGAKPDFEPGYGSEAPPEKRGLFLCSQPDTKRYPRNQRGGITVDRCGAAFLNCQQGVV